MKVKWNLFAEGECEEKELPIDVRRGTTFTRLYIKRKCPICNDIMWIRYGLQVCDRCIP